MKFRDIESARKEYVDYPAVESELEVRSYDSLIGQPQSAVRYRVIRFEISLNNLRYINKALEKANSLLIEGGRVFGTAVSNEQRRFSLKVKYGAVLSQFAYCVDFISHRFLPKLPLTKRLYFIITKGRNRPLAYSEIIGRLISCGFEVVNLTRTRHMTDFIAVKIGPPVFDMSASYGPLIRLPRVGWHGRLIYIRKFRTMHPYSEYLQKYLQAELGLQESGKLKNDFRITRWGRFVRKFWLDELPMIYNLLNGDLKIVGVRPISRAYLEFYPNEYVKERIQFKPGLIPPYYADMPNGLDEIIKSEKQYLNRFMEHPLRTDLKYFIRCMINIIFRGARSS